jgi:3-hydroxyisobutyrate dehydrogenase-like beta-hydroxyacid dehydrogenase
VHLWAGGVLDYTGPGAVIIEMMTVGPEISQQLYQARCERRRCPGRRYFREYSGCRGRRVDFVWRRRVGVFETFIPIFGSIAKKGFYMGSTGSGVAMKLVVNTLLGVGMQAIAERRL